MSLFPLFETIAVIDGKIQNLNYHQQRFEQAIKEVFHREARFSLAEILVIPSEFQKGTIRCRVDYHANAYQVKFYPYQSKKITHFRCVEVENWDYHLKFSDRKRFDLLNILQNEEVIIINNGKVSDCSIGNLLFLKKGTWYSSQDYLLKGTQLTRLIEQNKVFLTQIKKENLKEYEYVMMINALNPFDERRMVPISNIHF